MKKKLVIGALYCSRDEEGVLFFQAQDLLEQVKHSLVFEVGIDKYGRVMIPYQLREGMKKNRIVCVTGDRDVFRIAQKGE